MKKKPNTTGKSSMPIMLLLVSLLMSSVAFEATAAPSQNGSAGAAIKANADAAYRTTDYQKAISLYHQALKQQGVSPETYYNLGNAYYRSGNIPQAILYYEKARKLDPTNSDIQHNLEIAHGKTIDKLPPESEMFFTQWIKALQNMMTIDGWAQTALISLIVALLAFLAYLFLDNMFVRRLSFYGSVILIVLFVFANIMAWQRKRTILVHDSAIVTAPVVNVKSSPVNNSPDACIIHEGSFLRITDVDMKGWYGIQLSDGREGWVHAKDVAEI